MRRDARPRRPPPPTPPTPTSRARPAGDNTLGLVLRCGARPPPPLIPGERGGGRASAPPPLARGWAGRATQATRLILQLLYDLALFTKGGAGGRAGVRARESARPLSPPRPSPRPPAVSLLVCKCNQKTRDATGRRDFILIFLLSTREKKSKFIHSTNLRV